MKITYNNPHSIFMPTSVGFQCQEIHRRGDMKYATCMGGLWKLTDGAWKRYKRDAHRASKGWQDVPNLSDYGTYVGEPVDVTDTLPQLDDQILGVRKTIDRRRYDRYQKLSKVWQRT